MDRLETLRLFVSIVETGSLAAAGRRHGQPPPSVTRALAALEDRLGVRLLERSTRRSRATAAGQRLADQARRVLSDYDDAMAEASGAAALRGRLRIGAPLVFGKLHVAPIAAAFLDAQPQIGVDLLLADRNVDLIEEAIDIALRIGALNDETLVVRRVGSLRRVVAASPSYLAVRGTPTTPAALETHETIQFSAPTTSTDWRFQTPDGAPIAVRVQPRFSVNAAEAAVEAAIAGRGVVTALSYQTEAAIADGSLVRVLGDYEMPAIPVSLVFVSARLLPARVRAFIDFAAPKLAALPVLRDT